MTARRWALGGVILTVIPWGAMYLLTWLFSGISPLSGDDSPDMPWWSHVLFLVALMIPAAGVVGARLVDHPDRSRSRPWLIVATAGSAVMSVGALLFGLPFFLPATVLFAVALAKAFQD